MKEKVRFLSMLLSTLGASLLANMLAGKEIVRTCSGRRSLNSSTLYQNDKEKVLVRAGYGKEWDF